MECIVDLMTVLAQDAQAALSQGKNPYEASCTALDGEDYDPEVFQVAIATSPYIHIKPQNPLNPKILVARLSRTAPIQGSRCKRMPGTKSKRTA